MVGSTSSSQTETQRRLSPARILAALAFTVCAYCSFTASLAESLVRISPTKAYALAPWNGHVVEQYAALQASVGAFDNGASDDAAVLALAALEKDPSVATAVSILALKYQLDGNLDAARELFQYSLALSRRELQARLWAIEEAAQRGDLDEVLRNYDVALRTSKSSFELLYPVLASSLDETVIRTKLLAILEADPPWERTFLDFVASSGIEPRAVSAFFKEGEAKKLPVTSENRAVLTKVLFENGMEEDAWQFYSSFHGDADRTRIRNGDFKLAVDHPTVFDWRLANGSGLTTSMRTDPSQGYVEFTVNTGVGGELMAQSQVLLPGRYRLAILAESSEPAPKAILAWLVRCREGRELSSGIVRARAGGGQTSAADFAVPDSCGAQEIVIRARSNDNSSSLNGRITAIKLTRSS